jgi:hypothetical protein
MATVHLSPNDYRNAADKCQRLIKGAQSPLLKRLLSERAQNLRNMAIEMELAEGLSANELAPNKSN